MLILITIAMRHEKERKGSDTIQETLGQETTPRKQHSRKRIPTHLQLNPETLKEKGRN